MAIIHCGLKDNLKTQTLNMADFNSGIILRMISQRNHSRDRCMPFDPIR